MQHKRRAASEDFCLRTCECPCTKHSSGDAGDREEADTALPSRSSLSAKIGTKGEFSSQRNHSNMGQTEKTEEYAIGIHEE